MCLSRVAAAVCGGFHQHRASTDITATVGIQFANLLRIVRLRELRRSCIESVCFVCIRISQVVLRGIRPSKCVALYVIGARAVLTVHLRN
jgi:hypothetical protein